jgi:hypothetical protein
MRDAAWLRVHSNHRTIVALTRHDALAHAVKLVEADIAAAERAPAKAVAA